jgi:hypothetical protein
VAQKRGKGGEKLVETYRAIARARRIADVRHVPVKTVRTKQGIVFKKHGDDPEVIAVDGVGCTLRGPRRFIAEEVKTTASDRLYLSEVTPGERAYLDAIHAAGHLALLTIVMGPARAVHVCEWADVRHRTSLTAEDLRPFLVRPDTYLVRLVPAVTVPPTPAGAP